MSEIKEFVFLEQLVPKVDHDSAISEKEKTLARIDNINLNLNIELTNLKLENSFLKMQLEEKDKNVVLNENEKLKETLKYALDDAKHWKSSHDALLEISNLEIERLKTALDVAINVLHVV